MIVLCWESALLLIQTLLSLFHDAANASSSYHEGIKKPPKIVCCGAHEAVRPGGLNSCELRNCENYGTKFNCPAYCDLRVGPCDCKIGYYRNVCGRCVRPWQCNDTCTMETVVICTGPNEVYVGCLNRHKQRQCTNRGKDLTPTDGEQCEVGVCDCAENFWRNDCGQCVTDSDCDKRCKTTSKNLCPQPNEQRVGCGCDEKSKFWKCRKCSGPTTYYRRTKKNKDKCICKKNFVQSNCKSKRCILKENCGQPCKCTDPCANRKNEIYTVINGCNENTCVNKDRRYIKACEKEGRLGCDCIPGYWRDRFDRCVPPEACNVIVVERTKTNEIKFY